MAQYCTCATCTNALGIPAGRIQGQMEAIQGARIVMQPGWTLAHWSAAQFQAMQSTEIHDFHQLQHKLRVGASFYLYQGATPNGAPNSLRMMGLGGVLRYTIDDVIGNQLHVYQKGVGNPNPLEVAVVLGCGGSIAFNQLRQATAFNVNINATPTITIV